MIGVVCSLAHNEFSPSCFQDGCLFAAQIIFGATFVCLLSQLTGGHPPKLSSGMGALPLRKFYVKIHEARRGLWREVAEIKVEK